MPTIEVDVDVFAYLQACARPFVETTPNHVLRRLLRIPGEPPPPRGQPNSNPPRSGIRRKQPKADLRTLIRAGALMNGQTLQLRDYRGNAVPGAQAVVNGSGLLWSGKQYSMSRLASVLLKQQGFVANAVRGPVHWYTAEGVSIKDLWERTRGAAQQPHDR